MTFKTQEEKFSYAIGLSMASNLLQSRIKDVDFEALFAAIKDAMEGREPRVAPQDANKIIEEYFINQQNVQGAINLREGKEFLEKNKLEEE